MFQKENKSFPDKASHCLIGKETSNPFGYVF